MNFKKCHEREGFVALDIKLRPAVSVPLKYVTLGGTTVFSELHGTVKHVMLWRWLNFVCIENITWIFLFVCLSIWALDKKSEVVTQRTKLMMIIFVFECPVQVRAVSALSLSQLTRPGHVPPVIKFASWKKQMQTTFWYISAEPTACFLKNTIFRHTSSTYRGILKRLF